MESSGLNRYKKIPFFKFLSTNFALGFAVPGVGSVKAKVSQTSLNLLES